GCFGASIRTDRPFLWPACGGRRRSPVHVGAAATRDVAGWSMVGEAKARTERVGGPSDGCGVAPWPRSARHGADRGGSGVAIATPVPMGTPGWRDVGRRARFQNFLGEIPNRAVAISLARSQRRSRWSAVRMVAVDGRTDARRLPVAVAHAGSEGRAARS